MNILGLIYKTVMMFLLLVCTAALVHLVIWTFRSTIVIPMPGQCAPQNFSEGRII